MYPTDDTHAHRHGHDHGHWRDEAFRGGGRGRRGGFRGPRGFGGPEGRSGSFGQAVVGLIGAARAAAHCDDTQKARVEQILGDARRAIFAVLAEPTGDPSQAATVAPAQPTAG